MNQFWDDHQRDLTDPEYAREFTIEQLRIRTIDTIMNTIDDERQRAGLSKAALARAIGANPAAVRRLLSSDGMNPTLGTLAELAAAVGYKVELVPMSAAERRDVTEPLLKSA